jgi:NRAMP (natural resistance-associated macrophage protein)-like metal ion transporter
MAAAKRPASRLQRILRALGPGLVTGTADDDPSGIATYSIVGAQTGPALLWTAFMTWPLMAMVQLMCARVGMVSGRGLAGALRAKFSHKVLVVASLALFAANAINIGADLSGMADAASLLTRLSSTLWVLVFATFIGWATIAWGYDRLARVLKWLGLILLAYVVTGIYIKPPWGEVVQAALRPHRPTRAAEWQALVALLGTTISPYLFFWQASQEVEEEKAKGRRTIAKRRHATRPELVDRRIDVVVGTLASNLVMFFIILTTAYTLHAHGITHLESSKQIAQALRPLVGSGAEALYTAGLVGTGMLAIPTLAGSAAYAFAEILGWRQGMDERFGRAPAFYLVVIVALMVGVGMNLVGVNPVKALYLSAVVNGVLAPFLLTGIVWTAADRKVMAGQPSSRLSLAVVGATALVMAVAAVAMFAT